MSKPIEICNALISTGELSRLKSLCIDQDEFCNETLEPTQFPNRQAVIDVESSMQALVSHYPVLKVVELVSGKTSIETRIAWCDRWLISRDSSGSVLWTMTSLCGEDTFFLSYLLTDWKPLDDVQILQ